jgi:hypothetical protein
MINARTSGSFRKTEKFLQTLQSGKIFASLSKFAKEGVDALSSATPIDTGLLASSWGYYIIDTPEERGIVWTNTNVENGIPVAILVQYGHGTASGGFVQGIDYINPAIRPIFDKIANQIWEEVKRA